MLPPKSNPEDAVQLILDVLVYRASWHVHADDAGTRSSYAAAKHAFLLIQA